MDQFETLKNNLISEINELEWQEPSKIFKLIEPIIEIGTSTNSNCNIGKSKFGGIPDLPLEISWPLKLEKPMVFFAQINLAEIAHLHKEEILPTEGILYFFAFFLDPKSEFGTDYEWMMDKSEYKVIYYNGDISRLEPRNFPNNLTEIYHFEEKMIEYNLMFHLVESDRTWKYISLNLSEKDIALHEEYVSQYDDRFSEIILGTPEPLQYGVEYDWAASYLSVQSPFDEEHASNINKIVPEFINLLSFNMWDKFNTIGGSNCHFGITRTDLQERDFDKTVLILQDT